MGQPSAAMRPILAGIALLAATAAAIQINPKWNLKYEVPGLCGKWKLGIDNVHPSCKPVALSSGTFATNDDLNDPQEHLGPKVVAAKEFVEFGKDASTGKQNTFTMTSDYWTDPPCFTRKKYCMNWNETAESCAPANIRDCPPFQNRVGFEKDCGCTGKDCTAIGGTVNGLPGKGTNPYCIGLNCPKAACMDEEYYPGCGSYAKSQTWLSTHCTGGTCTFDKPVLQMSIKLKGTVTNMFSPSNKKLSDQTCELVCPCKMVAQGCTWGPTPGKRWNCGEQDFAAYQTCRGCTTTDKGKTWTCPATGAFQDALSKVWKVPYTSEQKDPNARSTPVRFNVDKIEVTPQTADQVTYLNAHCSYKTWAAKTMQDISGCTYSNCRYLASQGLFAKDGDVIPNCDAGKRCLFAQVYRYLDNLLYISKVKTSYSAMMRAGIKASNAYTLISVAESVGCIASTHAGKVHYPDGDYNTNYQEESSATRVTGGSAVSMALALIVLHLFGH